MTPQGSSMALVVPCRWELGLRQSQQFPCLPAQSPSVPGMYGQLGTLRHRGTCSLTHWVHTPWASFSRGFVSQAAAKVPCALALQLTAWLSTCALLGCPLLSYGCCGLWLWVTDLLRPLGSEVSAALSKLQPLVCLLSPSSSRLQSIASSHVLTNTLADCVLTEAPPWQKVCRPLCSNWLSQHLLACHPMMPRGSH